MPPKPKASEEVPVKLQQAVQDTSVPQSHSGTLTCEWRLSDLQATFDWTQGDTSGEAIDGPPFGNGRWQLQWHFNSADDGKSCGLFLKALPTAEESQGQHPWRRPGPHKFTAELRSTDSQTCYIKRSINLGPFTSSQTTHGWKSFCSRIEAFWENGTVQQDDEFLLLCHLQPPFVTQTVPTSLIDAYSDLFDDPASADVVFLTTPGPSKEEERRPRQRRIHALKILLRGRSQHFDALFSLADSFGAGEHGSREQGGLWSVTEQVEEECSEIWNDSDYEEDPEHLGNALKMAERHALSGADDGRPDSAPASQTEKTHGKLEIAIIDTSYRTFRALLYFLYTDRIAFLPLDSGPCRARSNKGGMETPGGQANATEIFALADKMALEELRQRAFVHICESLTIDNISHQVLVRFAQQYKEIREAETQFFLEHWDDVRGTDSFKAVLKAPALYPGFEDVLQQVLGSMTYVKKA